MSENCGVVKNKILADGARGGDGEGDLQEPQQHGSQPLQEGHHLVQGKQVQKKVKVIWESESAWHTTSSRRRSPGSRQKQIRTGKSKWHE